MGSKLTVALELQPCCGNRSGVGTYAYELAKRLGNRDDIEFVGNLFNFLGRNDNSSSLAGIEIPIRERKAFPYGVYRRLWNIIPISYQRMFPEADLSIFFNYIVPPHISGKVMTTVHDMTYVRFPETMDVRNLRRLKKGMKYSIERSNRILTVSEFSKQEIVELIGFPEEQISVVHNAPSLGTNITNFSYIHEKYNINLPYLLYVGTIEPRKNLVRLIKAFDVLKREHGIPHQLILAGGNGWRNKEIYRTVDTVSCTKDIVFTGYISASEKNALYSNASAFVFPSLYEGFGIPPLEAMAFGCPVVCANVASLPEVAGQAAEFVNPLDEASIAQGIWNVISDTHKSQLLVQQGYEQVKKYTWDASARRLIEVCRTVLNEN